MSAAAASRHPPLGLGGGGYTQLVSVCRRDAGGVHGALNRGYKAGRGSPHSSPYRTTYEHIRAKGSELAFASLPSLLSGLCQQHGVLASQRLESQELQPDAPPFAIPFPRQRCFGRKPLHFMLAFSSGDRGPCSQAKG